MLRKTQVRQQQMLHSRMHND